MRLFTKKNSTRSNTAFGDARQDGKNPIDDENFRTNFAKLFSDHEEEKYVQSPGKMMRAAKKQSILQDSSPISISNQHHPLAADIQGPPLARTNQQVMNHNATTSSGKQMTPASTVSASSMVTPMFQASSQEKPPKFGGKSDIVLQSSPISFLDSPSAAVEAAQTVQEDSFEAAEGDDDIFMVEEATHRDFNVRRGLDLEEELIRTSATFRNAGRKDSAPVDMTAEEILRSQHLNTAKRPPRLDNRPPPLAARPPPLVASASPQSVSSSVFRHDGGFSTGGFTITSEGMVSKPDFALREDLEVQTLTVSDLAKGSAEMRDLKEFRRGPTIGAGAAGRVYLALHEPTSLAVAMKTVNVYDETKRVQLLKELKTLAMHVSRYLVRFYGAFYDGSGAVHIALEFMDRGCLSSFVKKFGAIPERVVRTIAMDCLRGLRFLHKHHVLHRDFKTANILLSRSQCCAKVSDFGLARDLIPGKSMADTFVGTVAYMSPERLQGHDYTYASDIWALGVSIVECLLGRYPFDRPQNYFDYIETTMTSNLLAGAEMSNVSEDAKSFIALCTDTDPLKRPTAVQLLEHAWLKDWKRDKALFGEWMDDCSTKSISMSTKTTANN